MMDLAPLLCVDWATERPLVLLIHVLLLTISAISIILMIGCINLLIVLLFLPWWPLVTWFKEPGSGLRGLNAHIGNREQIVHCSRLFHGDSLNGLDIADSVVEDVDDLNAMNVRDSIPSIVETFHVILHALIMLPLYGL
jgi:hypothetical protein